MITSVLPFPKKYTAPKRPRCADPLPLTKPANPCPLQSGTPKQPHLADLCSIDCRGSHMPFIPPAPVAVAATLYATRADEARP